jgi:hypothetical protein
MQYPRNGLHGGKGDKNQAYVPQIDHQQPQKKWFSDRLANKFSLMSNNVRN